MYKLIILSFLFFSSTNVAALDPFKEGGLIIQYSKIPENEFTPEVREQIIKDYGEKLLGKIINRMGNLICNYKFELSPAKKIKEKEAREECISYGFELIHDKQIGKQMCSYDIDCLDNSGEYEENKGKVSLDDIQYFNNNNGELEIKK